jgi:7-keto-8-aminopelargonate synthetase-like enzyme
MAEIIPRLGNGRPENGTEMLLPKAVVAAAVTGGRISINSNFLPPVMAAATTKNLIG